jgi:hypothetical protein
LSVEGVRNIVLWFMKPFRPQTKQYWRVVLLCFVAASTFWLLNALNKSYSTQTTYPVRFNYDRSMLVPIKPLPEEVVINVTGKGWKLLRKALRVEIQPAEIYIRALPRNNYLLGSSLRPALVNALDGLELNFVVTDTLFFNFDERVSRRIPVKLDTKQKITAPRYEIAGPVRLSPDSITFTGPSSIVGKLPSPFMVRMDQQDLTTPTKISVPVVYDNQDLIVASVQEVEATINVKPLLQEERQLVPQLVNAPANKKVKISPSSVQIRYQLFEDSVAVLNRDAFKAIVNFSNYNPKDSTITPELMQMPAGVRNVTLWPKNVKVTFVE